MKKTIKTTNTLCLILLLSLSLFSPLYGQTWQWAEHAGQEHYNDHPDHVNDIFVDSEGNSYYLVHYDGGGNPMLCGEPIERIFTNSGRFFTLVSLDPNGELRWYKALYGSLKRKTSYNGAGGVLLDTIYEESKRMWDAHLAFDGENLVVAASGEGQIRISDGRGGDTLLPALPYNPTRYQFPGDTVYSNNWTDQDVIIKIDTEGEILWFNALNSIYPVPATSTCYYGWIYPRGIVFDEEKNIYISYDIRDFTHMGNYPTTLPNNNPTYKHYCVKLNSEGEHIQTTSVYAHFNHDKFLYHNGKFYLFYTAYPSSFNFPGVELPTGLANTEHVFWARYSDNWELESWNIVCDLLADVKVKDDDLYVLLRHRLLKLAPNGDTTYYTHGYNTANAPFLSLTFIDDENIAMFGHVWTRFINEEFHFQGLPIPTTFDKSGVIVALFHEPTREFYYISPVAQLWKSGQKHANTSHIEKTPDGNLIAGGTFFADSVTLGEFTIENVGSDYDVFFGKFGFPPGAPTEWPQHPSTISIVEHSLLNKVTLFPNPVQNTLTLQSEETPISMVYIYDMAGRKVLQHPCFSVHSLNINLSHIPRGIYVVRIFTHAGVVERKLVKTL